MKWDMTGETSQYEFAGLLAPYRVLDLTDERGFLCGKILAEMGADVVKIEKPGGDTARGIGPFYHDKEDPEKSLFWLSYNTGKKGITLDIETESGKELFLKLVEKADFLIESFDPGYLEDYGLSYKVISKANPRIVMTSITPFGQSGPYAKYKACDLVIQSMSGLTYITGDADRRPTYWNQHLSYLFGSLEAACGTLVAHFARQHFGSGDHVDVSLHEAMLDSYWGTLSFWLASGVVHQRQGPFGVRGKTKKQCVWSCKDGLIVWQIYTGQLAWQMQSLIEWMRSEDMSKGMENIEWEKMDWELVTQDQIDGWEKLIADFFLTHSVSELYEKAVEIGTILYPVYNIQDLLSYAQLQNRNYWTRVEYPYLNDSLIYPGPAFKCSKSPLRIARCAPKVGEHNSLVYGEELGLTETEIERLQKQKII